jgi:asparagine N-glycosylation enzyme membrane subunit Stt3
MRQDLSVLLAFLIVTIPLSGCVNREVPLELQAQEVAAGTEEIGGKYNLTLLTTNITTGNQTAVVKRMRYVKEGRVIEPDQTLPDPMLPGLDWLKANTPPDSKVMAWWDYGNAIRAYGEREPVIDAPSTEILTTTVAKHIGKSPDEVDCPDCVPHWMIQDVANLLLAEEAAKAADMMKKHDAGFLYIHADDEAKSSAFYTALGQEPRPIPHTILGKALRKEPIGEFELVYFDNISRIYKLK